MGELLTSFLVVLRRDLGLLVNTLRIPSATDTEFIPHLLLQFLKVIVLSSIGVTLGLGDT